MGRKKDHFPLFLFPQISYLEWEKTEKPFFFSSFSFLFVSFLENENSVISSPLNSFLWKRWRGSTGKIEGISFYFSFLFSWFFLFETPSLFQFFLLFREGEWRGKRIKEFAPNHAKKILQEQLGSKNPYISRVFGSQCGFLIPFWYQWNYSHHKFNIRDSLSCLNA